MILALAEQYIPLESRNKDQSTLLSSPASTLPVDKKTFDQFLFLLR